MINNFDYIIVGAGSAGCVLANRLSANGKYSVCLLEAGGWGNSILIRAPIAGAIILPGYGRLYRKDKGRIFR